MYLPYRNTCEYSFQYECVAEKSSRTIAFFVKRILPYRNTCEYSFNTNIAVVLNVMNIRTIRMCCRKISILNLYILSCKKQKRNLSKQAKKNLTISSIPYVTLKKNVHPRKKQEPVVYLLIPSSLVTVRSI